MSSNLMFVIGAGVLAMIYSFWKTRWIEAQDEGTDRMKSIGKSIADGAMAFLKAEYRVLAIFVLVVAILLGFVNDGRADSSSLIALSFIVGAVASGLAGFLGMKVATKANTRTTNAARTSLATALNVAFSGGSVMGLSVVGLGVLGLGGLFMFYTDLYGTDAASMIIVLNIISGFSLGASSIALFARVGGGIYTTGDSLKRKDTPAGIIYPGDISSAASGTVIERFLEQNIPVININHIHILTEWYDLPYPLGKKNQIKMGSLFYSKKQYNLAVILTAFIIAAGTVLSVGIVSHHEIKKRMHSSEPESIL